MPLPISDPNASWPPEGWAHIFQKMAEWSAWYSADLGKLQAAYGGGKLADGTGFFASDAGGVKVHSLGRVRWFVGNPALGPERNTKLPIPVGAEICQASADLLIADKPTFLVKDKPTQARLDVLADDGMYSTLAQAAEISAALGGAYLKVTWDDAVYDDRPFFTVIDADRVIPEFRWGKLVAATAWQIIARDGEDVWRHLERHELDAFGVGVVIHGLYMGTNDKLGTRVSLSDRPETVPLSVMTQDSAVSGQLSSESPGLCLRYVPNQTPNRQWRTDPVGRYLGRSDLDGIEHLMDQLAETMSDWMRARRAARARIMFDKSLTQNGGPGNGVLVDLDQEVFTSVSQITSPATKLADRIEVLQPEFAVDQYQATAQALMEQILQMAGYSMQTFGVGDTGTVRTATEIESRERRSLMTRGRKIREWIPALSEALGKLLAVDRALFDTPNAPGSVWIDFPDSVQETQLALAQTVQSGFVGQSMSLIERVRTLHSDWNGDQIKEEVDLIKAEFVDVQDPLAVPPQMPDMPQQGKPGGPSAT